MRDTIKVEIISADIAGFLSKLMERNIAVKKVRQTDSMTYLCLISEIDYKAVYKIACCRGEAVNIIRRQGVVSFLAKVLHRPVLLLGVIVMLAVSLWLPTRVFFVEVKGNSTIPTRRICEEAAKCGVHFNASRNAVRSERVKNQLLSILPELQWVGINTRGCIAEISVKEKNTIHTKSTQPVQGDCIVAARDGVITGCIVQRGNPLCKEGQAVKAGQTLVSGYTDCGLSIRVTDVQAEITADTIRNLQVVIPSERIVRVKEREVTTKKSLLIGKKLIKFYKDSGILDTRCVKMYSTKYLKLPGGRTLPIALVLEKYIDYETRHQYDVPVNAESELESYSKSYLASQMIAGQILREETRFGSKNGNYYLRGQYLCNEMIGQIVIEERFNTNGEDF